MIWEGVWATMAKYKERATFILERIHFELDLVYRYSLLNMLKQDGIKYGNQYLDLKLSSLEASFRRWTWDNLQFCPTYMSYGFWEQLLHQSTLEVSSKQMSPMVEILRWVSTSHMLGATCRIPSIKSILVILINKPRLKYLLCCFDLQPKHIHKTFNVIFSRKKLSKTSTSLDPTRCEHRSTIFGHHKLQER